MTDYDDFPESPEDYYESGYATDQYYQEAQEDIRDLFESNKEGVYYIRQLQVRFEKKYFHWITNNAILGLQELWVFKGYKGSQGERHFDALFCTEIKSISKKDDK